MLCTSNDKDIVETKMAFPESNENWISHSLAGKICGHEIGIKWNIIDWVVESWKHLFLPFGP